MEQVANLPIKSSIQSIALNIGVNSVLYGQSKFKTEGLNFPNHCSVKYIFEFSVN